MKGGEGMVAINWCLMIIFGLRCTFWRRHGRLTTFHGRVGCIASSYWDELPDE